MNRLPHKVEGNQVFWFNGAKWLVRETLATPKKAEDLLQDIKNRGKELKKIR